MLRCGILYSVGVLSVSVLPLSLSVRGQENDAALRQRFFAGVANAATEIQLLSFRAQCEYISSQGSANDKLDRREYEIAIRGRYTLEKRSTNKFDGVLIRVRNGSYAFALNRPPGEGQGSLQFIEQLGVDATVDAKIAEMEAMPRAMVLAGYYLWTQPLAQVIREKGFTLTRIESIASGESELVRVMFHYRVEDAVRKVNEAFSDGFLVCDPSNKWVLLEYGAKYHNFINDYTAALHTVLEYGDTIGDMPIATKMVQTSKSLEGNQQSQSTITTKIMTRDVPEEEFYLTYYGLPEPKFASRWLGGWVWYLVGGIAFIIVGMVLIKRRVTAR